MGAPSEAFFGLSTSKMAGNGDVFYCDRMISKLDDRPYRRGSVMIASRLSGAIRRQFEDGPEEQAFLSPEEYRTLSATKSSGDLSWLYQRVARRHQRHTHASRYFLGSLILSDPGRDLRHVSKQNKCECIKIARFANRVVAGLLVGFGSSAYCILDTVCGE
ncbi:hypothetical protein ANO11243_067390 [Dothideomycetidae sp. 11243]|nr:hypothetical protein ANO11243_067390 [fungal sp. No.11243]